MWVYGDLYEFELSWVKPGANVTISTESYPGEKFQGSISAIDPIVNPQTRSVRFRAQVDNSELKLKSNMYVQISIQGICTALKGDDEIIAVPKDAVLDTGARKIVWVSAGDGVFEKRELEIGAEGVSLVDGVERKFYPVFNGLEFGDIVVTKGNFLIDSQSQITGSAGASYGGALGDEKKGSAGHAGH
jgi:Cu(I)/Ag(I) efflux system membrane fusion protein